jgi:hypothetical protein
MIDQTVEHLPQFDNTLLDVFGFLFADIAQLEGDNKRLPFALP